jgi:hypothetical protein
MKQAKRATHRPTGYSRTLEAAALFNALRRRGWTWDAALIKASEIFFVGAREIRRGSKLKAGDAESEDNMARYALAVKGKTLEEMLPPT